MTAVDQLTPIEIASGVLLGAQPGVEPLPDTTLTPREAFDAVVLDGLRQPPCGVTFSGGRDSSAVLAAAVYVARREGLPEPIAITMRWPDVADSDESAWQRQVIDHLGCQAWIIDELGDELDLVGPVAEAALRAGGLYFPSHYHHVSHLARHVRGGSLMTGHGGDALLAAWRWQQAHHPDGSGAARQGLRVLHALSPLAVRTRLARERSGGAGAWLAPELRDRLTHAAARDRAAQPRRWADRVDWLARRRSLLASAATLRRMAAMHDAALHDPFADRRFLAAMARWKTLRGPGDRTTVMSALFADVLPRSVLERRDKARLGGVYLRGPSMAFADSWDGDGFDPEVVADPEALRRGWQTEHPDSTQGLQAAFARSLGVSSA